VDQVARRESDQGARYPPASRARAQGEEMTEQEDLIQEIKERLRKMQKGATPFDPLAVATELGQGYSQTVDEIIPLVKKEADAQSVVYVQPISG
jgi:hypothetical protein